MNIFRLRTVHLFKNCLIVLQTCENIKNKGIYHDLLNIIFIQNLIMYLLLLHHANEIRSLTAHTMRFYYFMMW